MGNQEVTALANLLYELDKEEHSVPYEVWAEAITQHGFKDTHRSQEALKEIMRNCEPWRTADNMAGRLYQIASEAINE